MRHVSKWSVFQSEFFQIIVKYETFLFGVLLKSNSNYVGITLIQVKKLNVQS
jgi:hypothetical protein